MSTQDGSMFEKKGFLNIDFLNTYKKEDGFIKRPYKSPFKLTSFHNSLNLLF